MYSLSILRTWLRNYIKYNLAFAISNGSFIIKTSISY
jgi:hypothetical protein